MSEQPAISVDAGRNAQGKPIGLQISGQRFDDLGVLRLARVWEQLRPTAPAWPEVPLVSPVLPRPSGSATPAVA